MGGRRRAPAAARRGARPAPSPRRPAGAGPLPGTAAARRAAPRAGGLRTAAVGQVGGTGGPGAARVGRPGGGVLDQDRPAGAPPSIGAGRWAACTCSTRSRSRVRRRRRGRRCAARTPGTGRSRWRGGWRRRASSITRASRVATSGRSPPSSGSPRCCSPPPPPGRRWTTSCAGPTGRARASSTRRCPRLTGSAENEEQLEGAYAAYDSLRAFESQADRTRSSIEATAQALLRGYRFSRVLRSARIDGDRARPAARRAGHPVPDRRRQGLEAAAADLPGAAVGDRRPGLRARHAGRRPAGAAAAAVPG